MFVGFVLINKIQVGVWTPRGGLNTSLPKLEDKQNGTGELNRTLRVVTIKVLDNFIASCRHKWHMHVL